MSVIFPGDRHVKKSEQTMNSSYLWLHVVTCLFSEIFEVPQNLQYPLGNFRLPRAPQEHREQGDTKSPFCVLWGSPSTIWQVCSDFPKVNVKVLRGLCGPKVKSRSRSHKTFSWKEKKRLQCFLCFFVLFCFWFRDLLTCFFWFFFILGGSRNETRPPHNRGALSTGP